MKTYNSILKESVNVIWYVAGDSDEKRYCTYV